jgi:hypothetical protein
VRTTRTTAVAVASALLLTLVGVVTSTVSAGAAGTTPTYEPDPGAVGTVTFYNAAGVAITSGSTTDQPLAAYYKASGPKVGSFAFNKGSMVLYTPQDGVATGSWTTGEQTTNNQDYTTLQATYPTGLTDPAGNVVIKGAATDQSLASHITNFPSASALNPGVYQIRIYTSASAITYYTADVKVTGSSWSMVYPTVATPDDTTTALSASPAGTADTSSPVVLTATVSDTTTPATKPAGTVAFKDGVTTLAAAVAVNATGVATYSIPPSTLAIGNHSFSAEYTPSGSFNGSTSSAVSYAVTLPKPGVIVGASAGAARVGVASTCNAGSWTYAGGFTYAWFLDAAVTPFATTASSGILPAAYYNHKVKCVVTAFNPSGSTASTAAQVTVAAGAASRATTRPKILGTLLVGKILSAYKGVWSPAPTSYSYVWKRGTLIVSRATTYKTTSLDKGKYLTLTVSAVRAGYLTGVASSLPVKIG